MHKLVVNARGRTWSPDDIYIGGWMPSIPQHIEGSDGFFSYPLYLTQEPRSRLQEFEVIARRELEINPHYRDRVRSLHGKTLVCWCAPQPCHGEVLVKLAEELYDAERMAGESPLG